MDVAVRLQAGQESTMSVRPSPQSEGGASSQALGGVLIMDDPSAREVHPSPSWENMRTCTPLRRVGARGEAAAGAAHWIEGARKGFVDTSVPRDV